MRGKICGFLACLIFATALLCSPVGAYAEGADDASQESRGSINIEWDDPLFTFECDREWDATAHQYVIANRQRQSNMSTLRVSRTGDDVRSLSVVLRFVPALANCFKADFSSNDLALSYTGAGNEVVFELPEGGTGSIGIQLFYIGNEDCQESLMGQVGSIQTIVTPIENDCAEPEEKEKKEEAEEAEEEEALSPETMFISDAVNGCFYSTELCSNAEESPSWQISNGRLPNGLRLCDGVIFGVPRDEPGLYSVSLSDGKESSLGYTYQFNLIEREAADLIVADVLAEAKVGENYICRLECVHPVTVWSIGYGKLPEGMTLSPEGRISGVPLETGLFIFALVESNGITADCITEEILFIADASSQLTSEQALAAISEDPQVKTTLPDGMADREYDFALMPKIDTAPIWSVSSALPEGLTFDKTQIAGIPNSAGEYTLNLELRIADIISTKSLVLSVEACPVEPTPTAEPTPTPIAEPALTAEPKAEPAPTAEPTPTTKPTPTDD